MTGIEVGVALVVGVLLGRILPDRRRGPKSDTGPVCGCKHHLSYHDPKTGRCTGRVKDGIFPGDTTQCTCRQYSGPQPMPEYYAPEIAS